MRDGILFCVVYAQDVDQFGESKVVGVVPHIDVKLDDEDSLSDRFYVNQIKDFDIAIFNLMKENSSLNDNFISDTFL